MKIGGVYILSRRSIARMLATFSAALMMFYAAATAPIEATVRRIHSASLALHSLDLQMIGRLARTVVPDILYLEYKALYLELKASGAAVAGRAAMERRPYHAARRDASPHHGRVALLRDRRQDGGSPCGRLAEDGAPHQTVVTKADLRAAVKTILRGEDVNAAKPGPRLTPAKKRQIEAAEAWRASHAGCSLHNACIRSFVPARGGYRSAKALYECMRRQT